jgi:hypothetical protein
MHSGQQVIVIINIVLLCPTDALLFAIICLNSVFVYVLVFHARRCRCVAVLVLRAPHVLRLCVDDAKQVTFLDYTTFLEYTTSTYP